MNNEPTNHGEENMTIKRTAKEINSAINREIDLKQEAYKAAQSAGPGVDQNRALSATRERCQKEPLKRSSGR